MLNAAQELSLYTTQSELGNLLKSDKFGLINVMSFANGETINDGVTDATTAIQAAIDYVSDNQYDTDSIYAGTGVFFPDGRYLISASLNIRSRNIRLYGLAKRTGDTYDNVYSLKGGAVIIPEDTADPAILLDTKYDVGGFAMENITMAKAIGIDVARTGTAIKFLLSTDSAQRLGFYFNRVNITGFDKVFYTYKDGLSANYSMGDIVIEKSYLSWNTQIHEYTDYAEWYKFVFRNNIASQNGILPYTGGAYTYGSSKVINLIGTNIDITNNLGESCPNFINVNNMYIRSSSRPGERQGINIDNNYFEGNFGDYIIRLDGCNGFYIGSQNIESTAVPTSLTDLVRLDSCKNGESRVFSRMTGCVDVDNTLYSEPHTQIDTEGTTAYFCTSGKLVTADEPYNLGNDYTYSAADERAVMPIIGQTACSKSTKSDSYEEFSFSVPSGATVGNFAVITMPILLRASDSYPRFDVIINSDAIGVNDSTRFDFLSEYIKSYKWYLFTFAIKLTDTATTCALRFYPFVNKTGTSRVSNYLKPTLYTTNSLRNVKSWFNTNTAIFNELTPTAGTWKVNDSYKLYYSNYYEKTICTTAGAPGTWQTLNPIILRGSASWNPGDLLDGAGETSASITVTGAELGNFVVVSAPYDLQGITCNGYVDAANSVKIRLQNETTGAINLADGVWRVRVFK